MRGGGGSPASRTGPGRLAEALNSLQVRFWLGDAPAGGAVLERAIACAGKAAITAPDARESRPGRELLKALPIRSTP